MNNIRVSPTDIKTSTQIYEMQKVINITSLQQTFLSLTPFPTIHIKSDIMKPLHVVFSKHAFSTNTNLLLSYDFCECKHRS